MFHTTGVYKNIPYFTKQVSKCTMIFHFTSAGTAGDLKHTSLGTHLQLQYKTKKNINMFYFLKTVK